MNFIIDSLLRLGAIKLIRNLQLWSLPTPIKMAKLVHMDLYRSSTMVFSSSKDSIEILARIRDSFH
jgi:hypothetical protein